MSAYALDQFDKKIDAVLQWKLSETIDGFTPATSPKANMEGVTINEKTGLITVTPKAKEDTDIFVTAYYSDTVKQTYNIRLSKEISRVQELIFNLDTPKTVKAGDSFQIQAKAYDQYMKEADRPIAYQLSEDISANKVVQIDGVSLTVDGKMVIDKDVPKGTQLVVTARYDNYHQNTVMTVA